MFSCKDFQKGGGAIRGRPQRIMIRRETLGKYGMTANEEKISTRITPKLMVCIITDNRR